MFFKVWVSLVVFTLNTAFDYHFLWMKVNEHNELMSKCSKAQSGADLISKVVLISLEMNESIRGWG